MHTPAIVPSLAGIWLGALVAIDLIETPAKFSLKGLDRNTAVALGRVVFRRLGWLEMALGAALILEGWRTGGWPLWLSVALWLITLALCLVVRPALERRMEGRDLDDPETAPTSDVRAMHRLHRLYVAADGAKLLLLIALLVLVSRS